MINKAITAITGSTNQPVFWVAENFGLWAANEKGTAISLF
jgi:hypothetical protein